MPDPALAPEELPSETALRAYAAMINRRDPSRLAPYLADDFHYASQAVYGELESAAEYLTYMTGKCATWRKSGKEKWPRAQMGEQTEEWPGNAGDPCVIIEQYGSVLANVFAKVAGGKIMRLDMCHVAPTPGSAKAENCNTRMQKHASVECLNRMVRYHWLTPYQLESSSEVQEQATRWTCTYNNEAPSMALGGIAPKLRLAMAI